MGMAVGAGGPPKEPVLLNYYPGREGEDILNNFLRENESRKWHVARSGSRILSLFIRPYCTFPNPEGTCCKTGFGSKDPML